MQDNDSRRLYFVAAGLIKVLRTLKWKDRFITVDLGYYRKGQYFGCAFAKLEEKNMHTWIAKENSTVYSIAKNDFQRLFGKECVAQYKIGTNLLECADSEIRFALKYSYKWDYSKNLIFDDMLHKYDIVRTDTIPKTMKKSESHRILNSTCKTNFVIYLRFVFSKHTHTQTKKETSKTKKFNNVTVQRTGPIDIEFNGIQSPYMHLQKAKNYSMLRQRLLQDEDDIWLGSIKDTDIELNRDKWDLDKK